jgi:carbamoyltransferase
MKILGFNYDLFISSVCYLDNNRILFASPEERFSREKNSRKFPHFSMDYYLKKNNIKIDQIDYFVSSYNPGVYLNKFNPIISNQRRHFSEHLISLPDNILNYKSNRQSLNSNITSQNFKFDKFNLKTFFVNHHDAHAAYSFYSSGFSNALTLVIDLQGEVASTSIYICKKNSFKKIHQIDYPNSLGMLYATITEFLGYKANSDEWKVMAISNLAKKKNDALYRKFRSKIIDYDKYGNYKLNLQLFNSFYPVKPNLYNDELIKILGKPLKSSDIPNKRQIDIANVLQQIIEEIIQNLIQKYVKKYKLKNICLGGGVFMNCLMNGKLERKFKNNNFFIPFAPDDSGNAMGAALYLKNNILKSKSIISNIKNPFLGINFSDVEIEKELKKFKIKYKKITEPSKVAAKLLYDEYIIGWFQGNAEFGQRALGNRSILANPLQKDIKIKLNKVIKYRENFRPFAPAILSENFLDYFEVIKKNINIQYMEKIYFIKKKYLKRMESITHSDGSARVQTVNNRMNSKFYDLIKEFKKLSDLPIVINTSFNIKNEPIVNSPKDAIKTFYNSGLDKLIIGNFLLSK